jgi:hypothetical protein
MSGKLTVHNPNVRMSARSEKKEQALHAKATPRAQDGKDSSTSSAKT